MWHAILSGFNNFVIHLHENQLESASLISNLTKRLLYRHLRPFAEHGINKKTISTHMQHTSATTYSYSIRREAIRKTLWLWFATTLNYSTHILAAKQLAKTSVKTQNYCQSLRNGGCEHRVLPSTPVQHQRCSEQYTAMTINYNSTSEMTLNYHKNYVTRRFTINMMTRCATAHKTG